MVSARQDTSLISSKAGDGEASASTVTTAAGVVTAMSRSASLAILKTSVSPEAVTRPHGYGQSLKEKLPHQVTAEPASFCMWCGSWLGRRSPRSASRSSCYRRCGSEGVTRLIGVSLST
ncbi:hypothetical protein HPB50_008171 [Hyalomma asiaticum]|uniref:Uncharacterized protein n=1 Tax=Hyalomma asiaticum TaxID=266040 RepID=A0ACB7TEM9_HYAAI|nr:hypothetical protein HPB50_008171 [Hyalomma asiaticum]